MSVRVEREQGATFVELFFDLVFVYAVTQLTSFLLHDLTWSGAGHALVLFWLVWWSWTQFTWTLNEADTEHSGIRLSTLVATAVAFFLAQAVPDAYGDAGRWFAGSYVVARLIGLAVHWWVFAEDELQRQALRRWVLLSQLGLVLVLVGGFAEPESRVWWWLGAVVADIVAAGLAGSGVWELEAGHFAERHGLIVIIALGESLIAAGVASSESTRDLTFALVAAGAVGGACALWWTYFGSLQRRLEEAMHAVPVEQRGTFARDVFSLAHALVVAGVIGVAVGFEEAIAHPSEALHGEVAVAFVLGAALFVGGLGVASWRAGIRDVVVTRAVTVVVLLLGLPLVADAPAAVSVWSMAAVVALLAVVEARRPGASVAG